MSLLPLTQHVLRSVEEATGRPVIVQPNVSLAWLSGDIMQDRTPELRQYLMRELGIAEVTPETILPKLTKSFLEAQPDDWVLNFYEFLNGQPALLRQGRLVDVPLIRLEDKGHVPICANGHPDHERIRGRHWLFDARQIVVRSLRRRTQVEAFHRLPSPQSKVTADPSSQCSKASLRSRTNRSRNTAS